MKLPVAEELMQLVSAEDRQYSRIIDRFGALAESIADVQALHELLLCIAAELGFDHFAVLHHASLGSTHPRLIRIHSYPQSWEEELQSLGLARHDPVHQASTKTHVGFAWSDLPGLVQIGAREREVLARARRHGIEDGFTIPVNVPGEPAGSCSFALGAGKEAPRQKLFCAEQIGMHAFRTARRLFNYPLAARPPRLSPRELQCLRLLAAGKTDWEIAAILGISIETAHQYVKRARAAYDVVSRSQLVACGLRDALISYEDAIPPYG